MTKEESANHAPAPPPTRSKRGERRLPVEWSRLTTPVAAVRRLPEGVYLAELAEATAKRSGKAASWMFHVQYDAVGFDQALCRDNIGIEGAGAYYGCQKLIALGLTEGTFGELCAKDLVGRRVYLATHRVRVGRYDRLNVCDDAPGSVYGYFALDKPPTGVVTRSGV